LLENKRTAPDITPKSVAKSWKSIPPVFGSIYIVYLLCFLPTPMLAGTPEQNPSRVLLKSLSVEIGVDYCVHFFNVDASSKELA